MAESLGALMFIPFLRGDHGWTQHCWRPNCSGPRTVESSRSWACYCLQKVCLVQSAEANLLVLDSPRNAERSKLSRFVRSARSRTSS
eukprot:2811372-Lingulodinium_polyedra.AAC.1